jgi:hypothetical protein
MTETDHERDEIPRIFLNFRTDNSSAGQTHTQGGDDEREKEGDKESPSLRQVTHMVGVYSPSRTRLPRATRATAARSQLCRGHHRLFRWTALTCVPRTVVHALCGY